MKSTRGQSIIIFALLIPFLLVICGLAIDTGWLYYNKQELQNALDLAVVAAVAKTDINHGQVVQTAIHIATANGSSASEIHVIHPYLDSETKVKLNGRRKVPLMFLAITGRNFVTVTASAAAEVVREPRISYSDRAFDYAVFSGSQKVDLQIKGNGSTVNGNVHGNKKVAIAGTNQVITGTLEAVDGVSGDLSRVNNVVPKSSVLPMPNFNFDEMAALASQIYTTDTILNDINISDIILVNGNLTLNGGRVSGRGVILARGSIHFAGNRLRYATGDDMLAFYSLGDITLSSTGADIEGVLYAPNGAIRINGSNNRILGALIADQVLWATKDLTITGNYDVRTPEAFTVVVKVGTRLIE